MTAGCFRFGDFTFSPIERRLVRGTETLALGGRYLDALTLLLRERRRLVTKERFLDEVWRGVPVTDEALTQCIRALRRHLGDDAARPRFIETVPKHGYRFIAAAEWSERQRDSRSPRAHTWSRIGRVTAFAATGGAVAGVGGGVLYGLAATPLPPGLGATSTLLVMLALNISVGLVGGLGVGAGIAASAALPADKWQVPTAGGMLGGLATGGVVKLVGLDAFSLLFGRSPAAMTGPAEGGLLGAALGLAVWFARDRALSVGKSAAVGGLGGALAGALVPLLGGHLLGGSLNILASQFPDARFHLDAVGALVSERGFGRFSELTTATLEGALFGYFVAGALGLARGAVARDEHRRQDRSNRAWKEG